MPVKIRERAETCVRCHVGAGPEHDVDHDLIAAGHPRLEFELTAFLANLPPHWRERKGDHDNEAQAWAVGQVVTASAALRQLRQRAEKDKPWPEFAEYDCFACHHDLSQDWRRERRRFDVRLPGSLSWNERYMIFLPDLLAEKAKDTNGLSKLATAMAMPRPDKAAVQRQAGELERYADAALARLEMKPLRSEDARALIAAITGNPQRWTTNWDAAAQSYLALAALLRALGANDSDPELRELGELLAFPHATDSPSMFRKDGAFDERFLAILGRIRKAHGPVGAALPR